MMSNNKIKLKLSDSEKSYIEIISLAQEEYRKLLAKIANSIALEIDKHQQSGIK